MKNIDWTRKLTSRKLWLSVASFISLLIVALGGTENTASQVAALVMAGATVIGYTVGEGLADSSNNGGQSVTDIANALEVVQEFVELDDVDSDVVENEDNIV